MQCAQLMLKHEHLNIVYMTFDMEGYALLEEYTTNISNVNEYYNIVTISYISKLY